MKLYIDIGIAQSRLLLMEDGVPVDIYINDHTLKNTSGNIYKGRVENVASSLKCAFVNIGEDKNGLLHFSECSNMPKKGDELLVQVTREGVGDKGPRLTENLSIPSKNMVLLINDSDINISKKIQNKKVRNNLFNIGKTLLKEEDGFGVIFRTSCQNLAENDIEEEFKDLLKLSKNILSKWKFIKGSVKVYDGADFIDHIKREYISPKITDIYINSLAEIGVIMEYIIDYGYDCNIHNITETRKEMNIIQKTINKALEDKIETSSGNIIIDEAEAFSIIDVNYNKIEGDTSKDKGPLKGNLDCCRAVATAIKLKNLSGIILVDFVNMEAEEDNNRVIDRLTSEFFKNNVKATIHGFTKLSLLEITRAKKALSLQRLVYKDRHKSVLRGEYYLKNLEDNVVELNSKSPQKDFTVYVSDDIFSCSQGVDFEREMLRIHNIKITLKCKKDITGYIIDNNHNSGFARVSIGSKNILGSVLELKEDGDNIYIKLHKNQ
ncbi:MAG: ribonuclease E/G [Clostridium sp.]|uniref:ribonuclease E/G n=1 Tax=Clostridium sp. TaxID=1506 RepID=UPI002FCA2A0F